jgi:hypothetical protein
VPGQNVTFMVFGDTAVENTSGDMSIFYFHTGFNGITCDQIPFDGLLIQTPEGAGISFRANGVDFVLSGDSVLKADPTGEMTVTIVEGTGQLSAHGKTVELSAGTRATVPIDENFEASGPPSDPKPLSEKEIMLNCRLFGTECPSLDEIASGLPSNTPVPIDPIIPTNTSVPVDESIPTNTSVPGTPGLPTNTSVPLSTNTSVPIPTNTSEALPTRTPTKTPFNMPTFTTTRTPTKTNTTQPTKTKTSTTVPTSTATNTSTPTATRTPTPTNTSIPPTPTETSPPPFACSEIVLSNGSGPEFIVTNNSAIDVLVTEITLTWPAANGKWTKAWLDGDLLFSGKYDPPSATVPINVNPLSKRTVETGNTEPLSLEFTDGAEANGYDISVKFDGGGTTCTKGASH